MKRSNSKELNIVTVIVVLALAFLCIFHVTYSYFTSSYDLENSGYKFGNIGVQFYYATEGVTDGTKIANSSSITLTPKGGTVSRGVAFNLTYDDDTVTGIGFAPTDDTCDVFIRYWVDAYLYDENDALIKTTNYGQYFTLMINDSDVYSELKTLTNESDSTKTYDNKIYYTAEILSNTMDSLVVFDQVMIDTGCPEELIGSDMQISVSFEAVQVANNAYLYEFDDEKGYSPDWEGLVQE